MQVDFYGWAQSWWQRAMQVPTGPYTVVAAGIAFLGIRHQLKAHAQRERDDRETDMRREAYLAACGAVAANGDFLNKCADFTVTDIEHRAITQTVAADFARVFLVGNIRTVSSLAAYNEKYLGAMTQLILDRAELMAIKRQLELSELKLIQFQAALQDAVKDAVKDRLKTGTVPQSVDSQFLDEIERRLKMEVDERRSAISKKSLSILQKVLLLQIELAPLSAEVLISARLELGFKIDEARLRTELQESAIRAQKIAGRCIDTIRTHIADLSKTPVNEKSLPSVKTGQATEGTHPTISSGSNRPT